MVHKKFININLPFYVGVVDGTYNLKLPNDLIFSLFIDKEILVPKLVLTNKIKKTIKLVYKTGSMLSTPLGESSLSTKRLDEFKKNIEKKLINRKRIIEIGCGNGVLLNEFQKKGYSTLGFEIGPQSETAKKKFNLKIFKKEFKSCLLKKKVDCIFSSGCLEHIIDPLELLNESFKSLNDNGLFFASVPNSDAHFKSGSIEELCFEHVNYFTPKNAVRFLQSNGFQKCGYKLSKARNELFFWGYKDKRKKKIDLSKDKEKIISEEKILHFYEKKIQKKWLPKILYLKKKINDGYKVGFYAGGYSLAWKLREKNIYFFDGDEYKWNKRWLTNLKKIESPKKIKERKIDILVICRPHYFYEIETYLQGLNCIPKVTKLININNI